MLSPVLTANTDTNIVFGIGDITAGIGAQGYIAAAGGIVNERPSANARVVCAGGIEPERINAIRRVVGAGGVAKERIGTVGRIEITSVMHQRSPTNGRVVLTALALTTGILTNSNVAEACGVVPERAYTDRCILRSSGVGKHRAITHRRVSVAGGVGKHRPIAEGIVKGPSSVAKERFKAKRIIIVPSSVAKEREGSIGRVLGAGVLLKSAPAPVAVFWSAVLNTSVPPPTPVLKLPVLRLLSENQPTPVLNRPVVRVKRAFCPSAVLLPG